MSVSGDRVDNTGGLDVPFIGGNSAGAEDIMDSTEEGTVFVKGPRSPTNTRTTMVVV